MGYDTEFLNALNGILQVMGKDLSFMCETINAYVKDAQAANNSQLVQTWSTIK
jgi:hypothetical protein